MLLLFFFRTKFRQGLVQGDKHIIYPVLEYLLEKLPDLKKRAYVARYLVKLEVPGDILVDAEVNDAHVMVCSFNSFDYLCYQFSLCSL